MTGRLYTRDWEDENGVKRTLYELDAVAVGHDLSRGRAVFERVKGNTSTSAVEDAQAEQRVGGESTEPVPDEEAPSQFNHASFGAVFDQSTPAPPPPAAVAPAAPEEDVPAEDMPADPDGPDEPDGPAPALAASDPEPFDPDGSGASGEPGRRRGPRRSKVPA